MRAIEARKVSIPDYLATQGVRPKTQRMGGNELWYSSPLRAGDSSPSFKVDRQKNLRFDHGLAQGGNAIDLVCDLQGITVREALRVLERVNQYPTLPQSLEMQSRASQWVLGVFSNQSGWIASNRKTWWFEKSERSDQIVFSWNRQSSPAWGKKAAGEKEKTSTGFEISSVGKITNLALIYYLQTRNIDLAIARQYLKEIIFHPVHQKKAYFALGFPCWVQGYEARNKHFKGFVGHWKTITTFNLEQAETITVFEGFLDFLAYLTYQQTKKLTSGVMVLNSTTFRRKALEVIQTTKASKVYLFLDNDWPGRQATKFLQNQLKDQVTIVDCSQLYPSHKDFNDYWLHLANN